MENCYLTFDNMPLLGLTKMLQEDIIKDYDTFIVKSRHEMSYDPQEVV